MKHLLELRPCDNCGGPIHSLFYVVRSSLVSVDVNTVNQFIGMHQFFNGKASAALLENFVPGAATAVRVVGDEDPTLMTELLLCQDCHFNKPLDLSLLIERANERQRAREAAEQEANHAD